MHYLFILVLFVKLTACYKKMQATVNCEENTGQLINVFNLMCTNIANEDETILRDACIGCFTVAARANNNQPSLTSLTECAILYMTDTRYDDCVTLIDNAQISTSNGCVAGYCTFIRCIRRVNSDLLIARCYAEASADNTAQLEEEQIILYKNITSCILAISRCSTINPITGQRQTNNITTTNYNKLGKPVTTTTPLYNTLQINTAGDLRVVNFPGVTTLQRYLCPFELNLRETSWMTFNC